MSLRNDIVTDLQTIEADLDNPTFEWQGNSYNFIPSITMFNRELELGGYQIVKLLTATVRLFDYSEGDYTAIFSNGMPSPQQIIYYPLDNSNYRIESIKIDPTNSYMRMICHSTTKGL